MIHPDILSGFSHQVIRASKAYALQDQSYHSQHRLPVCIKELRQWGLLDFPYGSLLEFGTQVAAHSLRPIVKLLTASPSLVLWIYPPSDERVYPPSWQALGVNLQDFYFACSEKPIQDLNAVFTDDTFDIVVLDRMKNMNRDSCAFLQQQARKHHKLIFVIRSYLLSHKLSMPFFRYRMNMTYHHGKKLYDCSLLKGIKGAKEGHILFSLT